MLIVRSLRLLCCKHNKWVLPAVNLNSTSSVVINHEEPKEQFDRQNFQTFDQLVESRRQQARKTVFITTGKMESILQLYSYCSGYGSIANIFQYINKNSRNILVEYEHEGSLYELLKSYIYNNAEDTLPIRMPFLKLRNLKLLKNTEDDSLSNLEAQIPIQTNTSQSSEQIKNCLLDCVDMSEQMQLLYERLKMDELGWRLRFLACRKVEWILPAFLSHGRAFPFGSSVNTFGNNSSDVDICLDFRSDNVSQNNNDDACTPRELVQKTIDLIASLMQKSNGLGYSSVLKILHARVPIAKCHEDFMDLECDIIPHNMSGYYMSELLYLYGCCDNRVRPLVFSLRWWARQRKIVQVVSPSCKITNFTLTLMILYFLMNTEPKVVPTLSLLNKLSGQSFSVEGITYSYIRDITCVPPSTNTQSLEELLRDFFHFYTKMTLRKNTLSLLSGKSSLTVGTIPPLSIQNPIEPLLNVAKNTNYEEIERFKKECESSLQIMDTLLASKDSYQQHGGLLAFTNTSEASPTNQQTRLRLDLDSVMHSKNEKRKKKKQKQGNSPTIIHIS